MISEFRTPLLADCDRMPYILAAPLVYASARLNAVVTVPKDFVTDLASIPSFVPGWLLPKEGDWNAPAVVHDYLYKYGAYRLESVPFVEWFEVSRADADAVLLEAMCVRGVSKWRRGLIWSGVRAGGWVPWRNYRAADARKAAA